MLAQESLTYMFEATREQLALCNDRLAVIRLYNPSDRPMRASIETLCVEHDEGHVRLEKGAELLIVAAYLNGPPPGGGYVYWLPWNRRVEGCVTLRLIQEDTP